VGHDPVARDRTFRLQHWGRSLAAPRPASRRSFAVSAGVIGVCAALAWLCADGVVPQNTAGLVLMLCAIVAVIAVSGVESAGLLGSWRWVVISPLAVAALTWLTTFVLRPLELYFDPVDTIGALLGLGFHLSDLARAAAIAALGCATWSLGYLVGLAAARHGRRRPQSQSRLAFPMSGAAASVTIGLGVLLAGALFVRQGGPSAIIHAPGSLHSSQGSSAYGQLGIWLLQGTALYALAALLQNGSRTARRVFLVSAPLGFLSPVAIASRGLAVFLLLGAVVIYLRFRTPRWRTVAVATAAAVVLGVGLEFSAVARTYAQSTSAIGAIRLAAHTPVGTLQTADLSTFDDLLAMQQLVPDSIGWLDGRSLAQIPAALVPRAAWSGKPQSFDVQVTNYLSPGATAGSPIAMQGEFYWNFGLVGVALGALILGALFGASIKLLLSGGQLALLLYALVFPSTFALLTRALGTMTANTFIAVVGIIVVYLAQTIALGTHLSRVSFTRSRPPHAPPSR